MNKLNLNDVNSYVEKNIGFFHEKRIYCISNLKLGKILKRKNPYLFKAKYLLTAESIVRGLVDAHISSNEETIFGDWLEGLAIFINNKVFGGWKSGIPGIDLEFNKKNIRNIVSIKSGPNWGNSSQIKKMISDFNSARKSLRTSNSKLIIEAVNGCCYGIEKQTDKGEYFKYCGQNFWEYISGDEDLYIQLIEPLGHKAKEKNEEFMESYSRMMNRFTKEFTENYCKLSGEIDWKRFVEYNSKA